MVWPYSLKVRLMGAAQLAENVVEGLGKQVVVLLADSDVYWCGNQAVALLAKNDVEWCGTTRKK